MSSILDQAAYQLLQAQTTGQIVPYQGVHAELSKTASIHIQRPEALLELNCSWTASSPFATLLSMSPHARWTVQDNFKIYAGARIYINQNAELILGSGYINENLSLSCFERIEIGRDVAIGDGFTIRDSDNHLLMSDSGFRMTAPIRIGDHVWIGLHVTVLKGVQIGDGAVIGAGAVVTRDVPPACLAVGVPARVIKKNVRWE